MNSDWIALTTPASCPARHSAVGFPRLTSLAKLGPDKTNKEPCMCEGNTLCMTCVTSASVSSSIPLVALTSGMGCGNKTATRLSTVLATCEGTAKIRQSAPAMASDKTFVAERVGGSNTPGRYTVFSRLSWIA